jgi:5-methylcytosine-specific restriction endonuclease McrA
MTDEQKRELNRQRAAEYRKANRELLRQKQREYRSRNSAWCYERNRKWALVNPEKVTAYHKRSKDRHPDNNNKSSAQWRKNNPEHKRYLDRRRRARVMAAEGSITKQEWLGVIAKYGPKCLQCGKEKRLTMDHVVPISCGGFHSVCNVQPLCLNCNSGKCDKIIDYRPDCQYHSITTIKFHSIYQQLP